MGFKQRLETQFGAGITNALSMLQVPGRTLPFRSWPGTRIGTCTEDTGLARPKPCSVPINSRPPAARVRNDTVISLY